MQGHHQIASTAIAAFSVFLRKSSRLADTGTFGSAIARAENWQKCLSVRGTSDGVVDFGASVLEFQILG
jgi:hypothetical protein